jgi:formylglycine-generating enzyme required for sulfatase activity
MVRDLGPSRYHPHLNHPNWPVTGVSWHEAVANCAWMAAHLPSEAEWGRAARGLESRESPWGNETPDKGRAAKLTATS